LFASIAVAAALSLAAGPCELVTEADLARVLGAQPVPVPASEIGEETAPSCHWKDSASFHRVSVTVWSAEELPVAGMKDAASYFARLKFDEPHPRDLPGIGDKCFDGLRMTRDGKASGTIVVLKGERLIVFDFYRAKREEAVAFAATIVGRM
jgi:hypothetical protein